MIVRVALAAVAGFFAVAARAKKADVAPEITVVEEGYNVVAKMPCIGCPFLYQDTSKGKDEPWAQRSDGNSLLLNISLPYDSAHITINNAPLYSGRHNLPLIHANQVLSDLSSSALAEIIASGQLEASSQLTTSGGGNFGLSYRQTLQEVKTTQGTHGPRVKVFRFDVFELYSDLTRPPTKYPMDRKEQKILEVLLIEKPLLSALDPTPTYEILSAKLIPRPHAKPAGQETMHYLSWDAYGRKGTAAHLLSYIAVSFVDWIASGFWALFLFIMGAIVVFVLMCLLCIFGWGFWEGEYQSAQSGKRRNTVGQGRARSGTSGRDLERAGRRATVGKGRFLSPEELGLGARGAVVGVGKHD
ncbi:hypothetical protein CC80DRAFT_454664, partial [Byssothecium circinans]